MYIIHDFVRIVREMKSYSSSNQNSVYIALLCNINIARDDHLTQGYVLSTTRFVLRRVQEFE